MSDISNTSKLLSSLGLCRRAGRLIFGVPMICDALRSLEGREGGPCLVLEAADTSDNTHKRLTDKCTYYGVRLVRLECDGATLASALGKSSTLGAVALNDRGMLPLIEKYI